MQASHPEHIDQMLTPTPTKPSSPHIKLTHETNITVEEELTVLIEGDTVKYCKCDGFIVIERGFSDNMILEIVDTDLQNPMMYDLNYPSDKKDSTLKKVASRSTNKKTQPEELTSKDLSLNHKNSLFKYDIMSINSSSFKLISHHNVPFKYTRDGFLPLKVSFMKFMIRIDVIAENITDFKLSIQFPVENYDIETVENVGKTFYDPVKCRLEWSIEKIVGKRGELVFKDSYIRPVEKNLVAEVSFKMQGEDCTRYDVVGVEGNDNAYVRKIVKVGRYEVRFN